MVVIISNPRHSIYWYMGHQVSCLSVAAWLCNPETFLVSVEWLWFLTWRPRLIPKTTASFPNATHWINFPLFTLYIIYSLFPRRIQSVDQRSKSSSCVGISWGVISQLCTEILGGRFTVVYRDLIVLCYHLVEQVWHSPLLETNLGRFAECGISVEKSNAGSKGSSLAPCWA